MTILEKNKKIPPWLMPAALTLAGALVIATSPWLFSQERWVMDDPHRREHVFTLIADGDHLVRGAQNGTLRIRDRDGWHRLGQSPGQAAIMLLLPERELAVLNRGLWHWGTPAPVAAPDGVRISHAAPKGEQLVLGTAKGVLLWDGHEFHDLGLDAQVYRVHVVQTGAGKGIHAGAIATGMWHRPEGGDWRPNNPGLPQPVNALSLLQVDNGVLLAGTDQGLFWQSAPGEQWRRVDAGLGQRRVLALALDTDGWLWAGSDDGAYRVRLVQRAQAVETQGRWEKLRNPPGGLDRPVSWVVPLGDETWISAGSVYRLDHRAGPHLYQQFAVGLLLIALALYLLRRNMMGRDNG